MGATVPYKMRSADYADQVTRVATGHNMNLGFDSAIPGLRKAVLTITGMVDSVQNLIDLSFALRAGLFIRVALTYLASAGAGTGVVLGSDPVFLLPGCLILNAGWKPNAEQGQECSLQVETVLPFSSPGETPVTFTF